MTFNVSGSIKIDMLIDLNFPKFLKVYSLNNLNSYPCYLIGQMKLLLHQLTVQK
jgi:hypothetical protein